MNCRFCNGKMIFSERRWNKDCLIVTFPCLKCQAQFTVRMDVLTLDYDLKEGAFEILHYEFIFDKFKLNFELTEKIFTLWSYQKTGVAAKSTLILEINSIPNITPDNAKEKLKTLITFS